MPSRLLTWPGVPISPGRALPGGYLERPLGGVLSTPYMRISENSVKTNFAFWAFSEVRGSKLPTRVGALAHRAGA